MSWGIAVEIHDVAGARDTLERAVTAHFDEADRVGRVTGERAQQAREQGFDELADETQATADYTLGASAAGREVAGKAIDAAVLLIEAEHILPCTVSLTGDANPEHASDHARGLPARVVIGIVRA